MSDTVKLDTGIEVYESNIYIYLKQYIDEQGIQDMRKESQSRWNAALLYIYRYMFKDNRDSLLTPDRVSNAYDIDIINDICDIYINLCYEYEKEISIIGFSKLTGIDRDTIYSWRNKETRVSSKASDIYKKLNTENEESLSNMLISGRKNPVGILGALNRRHGWNMGQPRGAGSETAGISYSREEIETRANTVVLLPDSAEELPD